MINTLALAVLLLDEERRVMNAQERVWGYTGATGMVQSFAAGYFVWDLWTGIMDFDVHGLGTVIHAVCALAVSLLGYVSFSLLFFFLSSLPRPSFPLFCHCLSPPDEFPVFLLRFTIR